MKRELKLDEKQGRWMCSACEWRIPATLSTADTQFAFESHRCSRTPHRKRREDANQAAFRVVRDATEH